MEEFIEGIYDDLDGIDESMTKEEILSQVDSIMSDIESEMGWEDGPEEEVDVE